MSDVRTDERTGVSVDLRDAQESRRPASAPVFDTQDLTVSYGGILPCCAAFCSWELD